MKLIKWVLIGLGVLFLLWVFGILFKIIGVLVGILGAVITAVSVILFQKSFWLVAATVLVLYLVFRNKGTGPVRNGKSKTSYAGQTYNKIGDLDRRLDRLNDILNRDR